MGVLGLAAMYVCTNGAIMPSFWVSRDGVWKQCGGSPHAVSASAKRVSLGFRHQLLRRFRRTLSPRNRNVLSANKVPSKCVSMTVSDRRYAHGSAI